MTATPPSITRNLQDIRNTIRNATGNFDQTQLTDSQIDHQINNYYVFDFPEELRTLRLKTYFIFRTVPFVGQYTLPDAYFQVGPPCYVGGYEVAWHQEPTQFYRIWPEYRFVETQVDTGNSGATYTFTLSQTPILQGSVTISAVSTTDTTPTQVMRDVYSADSFPDLFGNGNNLVDCTTYGSTTFGTSPGGAGNNVIDYVSGTVTVTFNTAVPTGTSINCQYYPYVASRPRDVMLYSQNYDAINTNFSSTNVQTYQKQMIVLRAVPNDSYEVKMMGYLQPTQFLEGASPSQTPLWSEWWQTLAYGTICKILIEQGDHEEYERYKIYLDQAQRLAQRRILKQLASQRIPTIYSTDSSQNTSSPFPVFPIY